MKRFATTAILFSVVSLLALPLAAQTAGTGGGTAGTGGGTTGTGGGTTGGTGATGGTGTTGGTGGSGGGGGFGSGGPFNPLDLTQNLANLQPDIPEFEDNRNQGFVGPTTQSVEERGFVGGLSQFVGGSSQEGSFGGGVNSSAGRTSGGRRGGGAASGGNQNGFQVTRGKYIRARLRPAFRSPARPPQQTLAQVVHHLNGQPNRPPLDGITIRLEQGTAILTGRVSNPADAERIERQLRLEPGIYRIDNRLQIGENH